jgi:hypothetical protein
MSLTSVAVGAAIAAAAITNAPINATADAPERRPPLTGRLSHPGEARSTMAFPDGYAATAVVRRGFGCAASSRAYAGCAMRR